MPELPEVETIAATLSKSLSHEMLLDISLTYPALLEDVSLPLETLKGKTLEKVTRRGKFLWFIFEDHLNLIIHLRMEGKFYLYEDAPKPTKHTHMVWKMTNHTVHYLDTRKFSRIALVKDPLQYFLNKGIGLEPWSELLTVDYLWSRFSKTKRAIKAVLLDQSIVVGIGNIYADEILFSLKIHPKTPADRISKKQLEVLITSIRNVLEAAIEQGGTTVRSYTSSLDVAGRFQVNLLAYGRYQLPCHYCGRKLDKITVAGRTSVFCNHCQRVPI